MVLSREAKEEAESNALDGLETHTCMWVTILQEQEFRQSKMA